MCTCCCDLCGSGGRRGQHGGRSQAANADGDQTHILDLLDDSLLVGVLAAERAAHDVTGASVRKEAKKEAREEARRRSKEAETDERVNRPAARATRVGGPVCGPDQRKGAPEDSRPDQ